MKKTALTDKHIELGAKMREFAGYNMPISYTSIKEEHQAVRQKVGVFDVSHMGEFIIRGPKAPDFIQRLFVNDVNKLYPGKVQYNCMTNEEGGIIDDMLVYMIDDNTFMMIPNAANIQKDWEWVNEHNREEVEVVNISDETTLLAVQGPNAEKALEPHTSVELSEMKPFTFTKSDFAGVDNVLISATGYTGSDGFELYFDNGNAEHIWDTIFSSAQQYEMKPAGLGARDTLRLEAGLCLHGNDIDETTTPLEARLGWLTKLNTDFIGKKKLVQQKKEGVKRKLIGFEMVDRAIPRKGYDIQDADGNSIGQVTSGSQSPTLGKGIGMGYVKVDYTKTGTDLIIPVRKKEKQAIVVKMPFYKK